MARGALRSHHFGVSLPQKPISPDRREWQRASARLPGTLARSLAPLPSFLLLAQRPSLRRREAEPPARRPPIGSSSPKLPRVLLESAFHISCGLQKWPWAAGEGREAGKRWLAEPSERGRDSFSRPAEGHSAGFSERRGWWPIWGRASGPLEWSRFSNGAASVQGQSAPPRG